MNPLRNKNPHAHFRTAVAFSFFLLLCIALFLFSFGKKGSFIIVNGYYNPALDYFFQYLTFLGDGLIYVPIVVYCIFFNRKFLVPVISGIIICTILTHILKRFVFPDELRPFSLEAEKVIIHKIEGVPLNRHHSFPSGHTSTAFTMALLLCSIMKKRIWALILPLIAFGVGYSRVYLAQHFPTDVAAGLFIGIISAYLSLLVYDAYQLRQEKKLKIDPIGKLE